MLTHIPTRLHVQRDNNGDYVLSPLTDDDKPGDELLAIRLSGGFQATLEQASQNIVIDSMIRAALTTIDQLCEEKIQQREGQTNQPPPEMH